MALRVITICTGNICRSPAAATLLGSAFPGVVETSSAGIRAVEGSDIEPHIRELLASAGLFPPVHRAHTATAPELDEADLILTMTVEQRGNVLELAPQLLRRTFTLKEFARVSADLVNDSTVTWAPRADEESRLYNLLQAASRFRGRSSRQSDDDVDDPYRGTDEAYRKAFTEIRDAIGMISASLRC